MIVIDKSNAVWNAAFLRKSQCSVKSRVRHAYDNISVNRVFSPKIFSCPEPCHVNARPLDNRVRSGKIYIFKYGIGFIKNRYIGRTFIQPSQTERTNSVKIKLNAISSTVKGKRVVMIDDSIVRGTTSGRIVKLLRDAGAKEVHVRISSPAFIAPCYFGTDIDSKENLIACRMTNEEICEYIGADSLGYLSVESVKKLAGNSKCDFCVGCFTEKYPIEVPKDMPKDKFESKISEKK